MNFIGNSLYDKTSTKNININLTAQAHQWILIVGLSIFAIKSSSKAVIRQLFLTLQQLVTLKLHKHEAIY